MLKIFNSRQVKKSNCRLYWFNLVKAPDYCQRSSQGNSRRPRQIETRKTRRCLRTKSRQNQSTDQMWLWMTSTRHWKVCTLSLGRLRWGAINRTKKTLLCSGLRSYRTLLKVSSRSVTIWTCDACWGVFESFLLYINILICRLSPIKIKLIIREVWICRMRSLNWCKERSKNPMF